MISFNYLSIRRIRVVRLPFFSEISRLRKKFFPGGLNRFSQANRPCCAAIFRALLWRQASRLRFCAFRVRRCLLRVRTHFRSETRGRSAVLDSELRINPLEMFSDGCWRNSED